MIIFLDSYNKVNLQIYQIINEKHYFIVKFYCFFMKWNSIQSQIIQKQRII